MTTPSDFVVLWALPEAWDVVELARPDLEDLLAARIRERSGARLDPDAVDQLVTMQLEAARAARQAGVVLWASYSEGAGTTQDPLRLMGLTLTVIGAPTDYGASNGSPPPSGAATSPVPYQPLVLDDDSLAGAIREGRRRGRPPGGDVDVEMFFTDVVVSPRSGGTAVSISLTTPYPPWESEVRATARQVAGAVTFVPLGRQAAA